MAYYQANTDSENILCDECGDVRWATHPKYGTNIDSRLAEVKSTGVRWAWVPRYASNKIACSDCGVPTY